MDRRLSAYMLALAGTAAVAWATSAVLPWLGLASSAMLFLLPVLFVAARGGIGPGLLAALAGATAYNYLLLPPRFTFRIHGVDNIVSVVVLVAVALVTSSLATRLKAREREAKARAAVSEEAAAFSALLAEGEILAAPTQGIAWLDRRFGRAVLIDDPEEGGAAFSALDRSAASWSMHNNDTTGHGTGIMPVADWTFLPLSPRSREDRRVLAIARPAGGAMRDDRDLAQITTLAGLLGQALDRAALESERRDRERIEEGDRLRRALLASLAHDFRTPLTVIAGRLEQLAHTAPEAGEALAAARQLDRTIENLFDAARLEEGAVAPALESVDLVDVAASASDAVSLPPQISLSRVIPADLPFLAADPVLLHHILINLLENAVRHAAGRVSLEAREEAGLVLLSVADDGPGIPASERERIFGRFARIEGGDRKGSGLGLSIVKGFAQAMGIGVAVGDAPGCGACFTLTLPIAGGEHR